ncbi:hypothetical protein BD769DRAFT_1746298 [Suillus cothurnatus]|nr:hypothetical protein BD769DRAFT_1630278 [Suillus cothurnatus]KAG2122562.1 hypothetical protein BD769DRAFT_1746298 [Suillus cothurnatus]
MTGHSDPFYGHEQVAWLCARFITHLFACPEYPPSSSNSQVKLPHFISYTLHHTKLRSLQLKVRFPTARGSSAHHLFISAFMLASKVICDDTYPNKSWMERKMCQYLEWELNMDLVMLREFKDMVKKDFSFNLISFTHFLRLKNK